MPAEFHFLRPWWLLIIPITIAVVWMLARARSAGGSWQRIVDPALQRFVLARPEVLGAQRWPVLVSLAVGIAAALALAGPTWERLPVPAYRSNDAVVVALDLSRSMDATDVVPSRLARAKLKLLSLFERRPGGEVALVVFSAHAFTVTPLTDDERTVSSLVSSLFTDIMPSQGSYVAAGLEKAATLLRQAGLGSGDILLISDADVGDEALVMARDLRGEGIRVNVLAVGTEEGAPIPEPDGGFVTDRAGQVVVPTLNVNGLRRLAQSGGGRFAQLSADDSDLETLFPNRPAGAGVSAADDGEDYEADVWSDQGIWFAVLLLPLLAIAFRRGWVCVVVFASFIHVEPAEALEWMDLWKRPDQRGIDALEQNDPAAAAALFEDPQWRGAAQYRAGEYSASAATLSAQSNVAGLYNRGNALARAGELQAAIDSYDQTLSIDPDHEDARYNRDLVQELLDQNQEEQQQQQDQEQSESGEGEQNSDDSGSNESEGDSEGEQEQAGDNSSDSSSQRSESESNESSEQQSDESEQASAEQMADASEPQESELPEGEFQPEDIEEWASDQAAEQWLRRVPQDPGGLLRRKFLYQYQRMGVDQDGNYVWPGDETSPW